jgi:hypothetical protein
MHARKLGSTSKSTYWHDYYVFGWLLVVRGLSRSFVRSFVRSFIDDCYRACFCLGYYDDDDVISVC